ncbi:uncharacterized protein LOC136069876 [Quercus suber]|uniref:uncharacterized protein LOC136069876 n=1 Tax=Quercus suber TaxID=58331 RepID=UPI0032DE74BC
MGPGKERKGVAIFPNFKTQLTKEGLGFIEGCVRIKKNLGTLNGNFVKEGRDFPFCGFPKLWVGKDGKVYSGSEIFFNKKLTFKEKPIVVSKLKNAGATCQRMAITLLHDMLHNEIEEYMDDMIVKSKDREGYIINFRKFFERIKECRLRLNSQKCTFEVTARKLLGFLVSDREIEADPSKIKAILEMPPPKSEKEIRSLDEKVWQAVEIGWTRPKEVPANWDEAKIKAANFNSRALNGLYSAVTNEEFKKISSTETTKEA